MPYDAFCARTQCEEHVYGRLQTTIIQSVWAQREELEQTQA